MCFIFFFTSRRRHTRYWRDWSSDVCSSDLDGPAVRVRVAWPAVGLTVALSLSRPVLLARSDRLWTVEAVTAGFSLRSEERRVGEEGRSRWSPDYLKKNIMAQTVSLATMYSL